MSWWGKVAGGAVGFLLGGPLGGLLGAALGHKLDTMGGPAGSREYLPGYQERTQAAFFTATFSVMGHVAKSDGRVSMHEISMAEQLMAYMNLDARQRKAAIRLFEEGKKPTFNLEQVIGQFRRECHRRSTLMQMFLEIQVQAAHADGRFDAAENKVLGSIAAQLGFRQRDLDMIIEMVRGVGRADPSDGPNAHAPITDPYKVLGVTPEMPLEDIRKAYRRLLSQHHPDKLVSKGLPEEMIRLANEKTHEIREAWKDIQARHGR